MSATIHPFVRFALTKLARVFSRPIDDEDIAAYADALKDTAPEDVRDACDLLAQSERFWPRPVVIRDAIDRMHRTAQGRTSKPFPVPETYTDPETGERVELYHCAECLDRGFVPIACDEHGKPLPGRVRLSWSETDSVIERNDEGTIVRVVRPHYRVDHCERCCKYVRPHKPVTRSSYDERHNDKER